MRDEFHPGRRTGAREDRRDTPSVVLGARAGLIVGTGRAYHPYI